MVYLIEHFLPFTTNHIDNKEYDLAIRSCVCDGPHFGDHRVKFPQRRRPLQSRSRHSRYYRARCWSEPCETLKMMRNTRIRCLLFISILKNIIFLIQMGYANPAQINNGIHLRLFSRAFIIDDGNARTVFVSADMGMMATIVKTGVRLPVSENPSILIRISRPLYL